MNEGSRVEVTMEFPSQVTLAEPLHIRFLARVVRVEPKSSTLTGVAAAIEEYEFLPPEAAEENRGMEPGWNFAG